MDRSFVWPRPRPRARRRLSQVGTSTDSLDLSRLVTIVGAGFSKHASPTMPVLTDLGKQLVSRLSESEIAAQLTEPERAAIDSGRVPMGGVESWLTALASAQPFHKVSEQLHRRALFLDVSGVVAEIVAECEGEALSAAAPRWLARLTTLWHHSRSTVLTLNYDTLVEATVGTLRLTGPSLYLPSELNQVTARSLTRGFPPLLPRPGQRYSEGEVETFQLLKLHGSLNWWGRPTTNDLFSIVAGESTPRWNTDVAHTSPMRGLAPVIVPPIADKSGQYENSTIETLWIDAATSIRQATALVLFGYSLPSSDTTASALITENLATDTPIFIIDPNYTEIEGRLQQWLPNPVAGVGSLDVDEHAAMVDRMLGDLEGAAVSEAPPWHQGRTGGETHQDCFVRIDSADGTTLSCSGISEDAVVAGAPALSGGFAPRPAGPAVDPTALAKCRFVKLQDGRRVPIYRFDRIQNTSEHSIVALQTGPT